MTGDPTDSLIVVYNILGIIITIGGIGGILFSLGRWLSKRSKQGIEELKGQNEMIANEVRERELERQRRVEETTKAVLDKFQLETNERDIKLKEFLTKVADEYRQINAKHIDQVEEKVGEVARHSNLVNGNIANIRSDIADLQDDLSEILSQTEPEIRSKQRKRSMIKRRRSIETDRDVQHNK